MLPGLADQGHPTSPGMPLAPSTTGAEAGRGAYRMRPAEPHKAGHGGSPEGGGELAPEPSPLVCERMRAPGFEHAPQKRGS